MNTLILTDQTDNRQITNLEKSLNRFEQVVSRFLATRKSERTRQTYGRALEAYRATAEQLRLDPLKADCLIAYNVEMQSRGRDKEGDQTNDTIQA